MAVDKLDLGAAVAAGWRLEEVEWETKQEHAASLAHGGRLEEATALWQETLSLAEKIFDDGDPRLATSLANAGYALKVNGDPESAKARFKQALRCWDQSAPWIERLRIERKAKSSLFHLRMEALHWDQFEANARERLRRFAGEARNAIAVLAERGEAPSRTYQRWRGEKPVNFTDSRKLLSACLLLASERQPS